ncbi:MFS general substrate transporter [Massarina eburnea CBS 473.64]|uniref:MFS general substrate transporter n=1 Tax=Massarina eburnea CBS 473.64 TaxID=1395130 RepID=A0A6A6RS14_9PLEO|nr:MFS general substrate transporter [Massarina eburnea CBS 473.64]
MAYMLFKYIRRKVKESKERKEALTISDDSHLTPDINPGASTEPERGQTLTGHDGSAYFASSVSAETQEEHRRLKQEERQLTKHRWMLVIGLILPNFLASIDVTIVAPAIPQISSHFNHLSGSFNWIVAAYTLTFTTFVPASGQLADIYGRHFALQFQLFWILVGSVLCAAAQTWTMLLFGRAIQGLGAAGIMNLTRIILSDGVSLADNSINNTVFSLINGCSYAVGPVIGGYLTAANWRYCFVVAIPIAVIAHILIFFLIRKDLVKGRVSRKPGDSRRTGYIAGLGSIDWVGMITFIFGVGLIILAVQWGGTSYSWDSVAVIVPFIIGGTLFILFFLNEYLLGPGRLMHRIFSNQIAMIPSTIFRKKDTSLLMIINFAAGMSLVSAFYFVSYYWQLAEGFSPSKSGVQLLYYTPGLGIGVYTAMFLCNVWPKQTFHPLFWGSVVEAVGLSLMTWAISSRQKTLVNVFLAVAGAGTGLRFMPIVLHAAGIWPKRIAAIQSVLSFTLPLGETIGISMMGAVFSNKYSRSLRSLAQSSGLSNLDTLNNLPPAQQEAVRHAASDAVMWAFISILPFMALSIVAAMFLGNVWIGTPRKLADDGRVKKEGKKGMVMSVPYLYAVFTGNVGRNRTEVDPVAEQAGAEKDGEAVFDVEADGMGDRRSRCV